MGEIDQQRISAVKKLHELRLAWRAGAWRKTSRNCCPRLTPCTHLLVQHAGALEGCTEGSLEEAELASIVDTVEAYEEKRWPLGKIPGGKG